MIEKSPVTPNPCTQHLSLSLSLSLSFSHPETLFSYII